LPRTKQLAVCLLCDQDPCTCFGKKEKKSAPRKKAAPKPAVTVELPPAPEETPEGEAVPVFPSQTGRKRAKFARSSNQADVPSMEATATHGGKLPQDETSVAIRTLATARMLHPKELIKHADKINPPYDPELDRRLADWRRRRET
jgi:hypothetical protein